MGTYVPPSTIPVVRPPINAGEQSSYPVNQYENPYYLHSTDHAGLILVSDRLTTASDFHSWRRSILMALNIRNKLGFINGTISKPPEEHRDFGAWSRCNDIVSTWLMNSVDKKIGQSLLFISTAQGIWNNLLMRFKQDDAPRIFDIEQKLSKIEQGSMDVSTYYTTLLTLWEEHRNYVELPVCTLGHCECDAAAKWESLQQRSRVTKFLMGLNESFDQTRRHILMLKPIPTIEEAFNIVTQDERQKTVKPTTRVDNVAFQSVAPMMNDVDNAYVAAYNTVRPSQKPVCSHCGKMGHTIQKCYKVHGYPPGMKIAGQGYPYKTNPQLMVQPRGPMIPTQPRMQFPSQMMPYANSMQKANAVAHVYTENGAYPSNGYPYNTMMMNQYGTPGTNVYQMPYVTQGGNHSNLQDFSPQQIEQMISQFQAQVQVQESAASSSNPSPNATISEHGLMAHTSTSGTIITFPSLF
ncbi:Retrotransposon gag domain [Arabidopsis thaliana x Arabidopsis arenosa]|uniref:Retrotransposon gag domain n=1 Tax=Arabidopsis thaliana x Arabidopsis arenosa TaxID=1240361 RepID=A0A8T2BEW0_9BRAS|nr:Retrotransposon gag domain [Arabidopsis thaliana x Arabidopsis arenosa]